MSSDLAQTPINAQEVKPKFDAKQFCVEHKNAVIGVIVAIVVIIIILIIVIVIRKNKVSEAETAQAEADKAEADAEKAKKEAEKSFWSW